MADSVLPRGPCLGMELEISKRVGATWVKPDGFEMGFSRTAGAREVDPSGLLTADNSVMLELKDAILLLRNSDRKSYIASMSAAAL